MGKNPEYPTDFKSLTESCIPIRRSNITTELLITTGEFGYFARFFSCLILAVYTGLVTTVPCNMT